MFKFLPLVVLLSGLGVKAFSSSFLKYKNLQYASIENWGLKMQTLDLYLPKNHEGKLKIVVFIHGGSWQKGKKNLYRPIAKNLAKMGYAAAIINYPKVPQVQIFGTAQACAKSIQFLEEYQKELGISFTEWYVSGHSAGGHLAALLALDRTWLEDLNVKARFKGMLLIDAFGLDLFPYFNTTQTPYAQSLYKTFGQNPLDWQKYTPLNYIGREEVKVHALMGERTYDEIKMGYERFFNRMEKEQLDYRLTTVSKKKHIRMITQFFLKNCQWYQEFHELAKDK
jgi:pimeloyl-ACP methyl ester carboxylesterase